MKKKLLAMVLAAATAMTMLAGCGGDDKAAGTKDNKEASADAGEKKEESRELDKVKVAYMPNYASLWVVTTAREKGFFEEEGIEVELTKFDDGPTEIAAMESGSMDVAYIGPGAHTLAIQGNVDVFCFQQLGDADCVMGLKSHGVNSLEDLKGKKVAYASGTSSETILLRALNSVGLTMDDIEPYNMEVTNMPSAMISGSIDACAPWSPNTKVITDELGDDAQIFVSNADFSDIAADPASWVCMPEYAEKNKDLLVRYTRALYKAMDFGAKEENFEEVAGYVADETKTDVETAMGQTTDGAWITSEELLKEVGDGTVAGYYEIQQKNFLDAGKIKEEVPVEDYVLFDIMEEAGK